MADLAGSSSDSSKKDKPVIVRVKRKAHQSPLEAFWLEIHERPLKRPFLDFQKLSISDSSAKVEEAKTKKIFVKHVDTVSSLEVSTCALQSFVNSESVDGCDSRPKIEERRRKLKNENKQHKLLVKAKQKQEVLSKNARFEQIWRSRKEKNKVQHDGLHDLCHFYDVIRVDEETGNKAPEQEDVELEDQRIMASYLPLLREFIPSAAAEVESNVHDYMSERATKFEYDFYAVMDDINIIEEDASHPFPLVQVNEDDEFYDGPDEDEYESDDSNAEDNPVNDYPDEEAPEEDEDSGSETSEDEAEEADSVKDSVKSSKSEDSQHHHWSADSDDPFYEFDTYDDDPGDRDAYYCDDDGADDNN